MLTKQIFEACTDVLVFFDRIYIEKHAKFAAKDRDGKIFVIFTFQHSAAVE